MKAGFTLLQVNEWGPIRELSDTNQALAEKAERPMLVLISMQQ